MNTSPQIDSVSFNNSISSISIVSSRSRTRTRTSGNLLLDGNTNEKSRGIQGPRTRTARIKLFAAPFLIISYVRCQPEFELLEIISRCLFNQRS
jgi:hypothetical protein